MQQVVNTHPQMAKAPRLSNVLRIDSWAKVLDDGR